MKKNTLTILVLLCLQSCANISAPHRESEREISGVKSDCLSVFKNVRLQEERVLSASDGHLILDHVNSCASTDLHEKLDDLDRFTYFKVNGNEVWLKTLHGNVFLLKERSLSLVDVKFPVASFEIVSHKINFYNANQDSRFCTFHELDTAEPGKRNVACKKVGYSLDLE